MADTATAEIVDFLLPDLGEDIEEADVLEIHVRVGDTVVLEQPLMEIETEKATLDLPSSVAGVITAIHVQEGDTIKPGDPVISVRSDNGSVEADAPPVTVAPSPPVEPAHVAQPTLSAPNQSPATNVSVDGSAPVPDMPAADAEPEASSTTPARPAAISPLLDGEPDARPVFASPSVRRFAREIGVDIRSVAGSGPGGRISEADVKSASRARHAAHVEPRRPATPPQSPRAPSPLPDFAEFGPVERVPMSRLRRTIKRNMAISWHEVPHVTLFHSADITDLEDLRRQYRSRAEAAGGRLTITAIMLKIVAVALKAHPHVNSSLDAEADELILKRYMHLGVAVDTPRGLVVPVIRDVDQKNIVQIAVELTDISERARSGDLGLEDFRGSSFTLTNLGGIGTGHFTPIIHHPNTAILGLGRAERRAVWSDLRNEWEARSIMPLSFTFDHRVIDGADGARFANWITDAIRQPLVLALEG